MPIDALEKMLQYRAAETQADQAINLLAGAVINMEALLFQLETTPDTPADDLKKVKDRIKKLKDDAADAVKERAK